MWVVLGLAFVIGLLLSPWSGGFLATLMVIVVLQLVYSLIWTWTFWRVLLILASLLGWFLGKLIVAPYMVEHGIKGMVDSKIAPWVPDPVRSYLNVGGVTTQPTLSAAASPASQRTTWHTNTTQW